MEVHNRGLRKLDLVIQKFFIKKIFFYHIFPFLYKKNIKFYLRKPLGGKIFFYLSTGKILHFFTIYWKGALMSLSLITNSRVSTLSYSRSRTYLSYNTTGGGEVGIGESLISVSCETITRFKNGLGVGLRRARQLAKLAKLAKLDTSAHQNEWINSPKQTIQLAKLVKIDTLTHQNR